MLISDGFGIIQSWTSTQLEAPGYHLAKFLPKTASKRKKFEGERAPLPPTIKSDQYVS